MKKRIISIILAVVMTVSVLSVLSVSASAAATTPGAAGNLSFGTQYSASWDSATDENIYYGKFSLSSPGIVTVTATKPSDDDGVYYGLYYMILDKDQNLVWAGGCGDSKKSSETTSVGLGAGTYYLGVSAGFYVFSGTFTAKYKLSFSSNANVEKEFNGTKDYATPLTVWTAKTGYLGDLYSDCDEADFYKFTAKANTVYRIVFDNYDTIGQTTTIIKYVHPDGTEDTNVKYTAKNNVNSDGKHYYDVVENKSGTAYIEFYNYSGEQYKYTFTVKEPSCETTGIHFYGDWKTTKASTCCAEGTAKRTCTKCGASETKSLPRDYNNHVWNSGEITVEPTCTGTGMKKLTCTLCGQAKYVDAAPTGHFYSVKEFVVPPVEHNHGTANFICTKCGNEYVGEFCYSLPFKDRVADTNWAHEGIDYVVWRGLFGGTSENTFEPAATMNRAMLVTVLWRLEGQPVSSVSVPFTDLKQSWYHDSVAWAYEKGIVNGTTETTFSPSSPITREQLSTILLRYTQYRGFLSEYGTASLDSFPDSNKVSSYAKNALSWAVYEGLIGGTSKNGTVVLDPRGNATRAQVSTIIMRYCKRVNH